MKVLLRDVRAGQRRSVLDMLNSVTRKEIERVLDDIVKPALVKSHEVIVRDWKNKPDFGARKFIKPDNISVNVFPTGPNKEIWFYVDLGTPPHTIPERVPRRSSVLVFKAGGTYVPKTLPKPARTVSGGGRVTGGTLVFAKRARAFRHPGSEAREFTKTIAEDIKPEFRRQIENAFRRTSAVMRKPE